MRTSRTRGWGGLNGTASAVADREPSTALLTATERRALEAIDQEGLLAFACDLIAIPSVGGQESQAQRRVAEWAAAEGLDTDVWTIDLDAVSRHPDFCAELERREALGVVAWLGETAGGRPGGRDLMFNGHVDVVPPGDEAEWAGAPFEPVIRGDRVFGRGAADMKGGLACALFAVKAIRDAGIRLRGRVSVASVVGEEDGGTGTLATILRGHSADGAVVMEPTELHVVPAQAGSLMFRLTVRGSEAHGCAREGGVSAVEKFVPILAALRCLEAARCGVEAPEWAVASALGASSAAGVAGEPKAPLFARHRLPWPIEVGRVCAGDWASNVPAILVAEGRYGVALGEDLGAARRVFEAAVAAAAATDPWLREHPPVVEWWGGRFESALTAPESPIVRAVVESASSVMGAPPPVDGVTFGSDMRLLVNAGGIPTVLFGPGDVRVAHMPDEFVPLEDLRLAAETLVLVALRFCGHEE